MVEALYTEAPDAAYLSRIAGREITVEPLPDQDWIRLSQEGLPPVRAGRFFVYGAHDAGTGAAWRDPDQDRGGTGIWHRPS